MIKMQKTVIQNYEKPCLLSYVSKGVNKATFKHSTWIDEKPD